MTPAACIQSAIELWDKIDRATIPMDNICGDYFRNRRYIGSKDRARIVERVYAIMRCYGRLSWWCSHLDISLTGRNLVLLHLVLADHLSPESLQDLFNGRKYHPVILGSDEIAYIKKTNGQKLTHKSMPEHIVNECPEWAYATLKSLYGDTFSDELQAMIVPANLDVRVNTLKATRDTIQVSLAAQDVESEPCPYSPVGLRLRSKAFLSKTKAFTKGLIEIQDEGSQLLALICGAKPGMQVMDYCAGGGGKTLALAAAMKGKGRIVAMDIDGRRLAKAKPRLTRADVHNVELRPLDDDKHRKWFRRQKDNFDIVLVDAPCSSSGTWRRNPDLRWNTYGPAHTDIQSIQAEIIEKTKASVKPGGLLVYATCSLFPEENEDQVQRFLDANPEFTLVPAPQAWENAVLESPCPVTGDYLRLSPYRHGTDGFFAAVMRKCV